MSGGTKHVLPILPEIMASHTEAALLRSELAEANKRIHTLTAEKEDLRFQVATLTRRLFTLRKGLASSSNAPAPPVSHKQVAIIDAVSETVEHVSGP